MPFSEDEIRLGPPAAGGLWNEFESLLAYDWQDGRKDFTARATALYEKAAGDPELRRAMAERVLQTAHGVRPPLYHAKLWPLAFLLGQDASIIKVDPDFEGYATYLYRGSYYAVRAGIEVTPEAIDGGGLPQLVNAPSPELLYAKIPSGGAPVEPGSVAADDDLPSGPDIPWVTGAFDRDPVLLGAHQSHNIIEFRGGFWGLLQSLGPIDLRDTAAVARPDILWAGSRDELIALIDRQTQPAHSPAEPINPSVPDPPPAPPSAVSRPNLHATASLRAPHPLTPQDPIAEHRFAKVIGTSKLISVVIPYFNKESTVFRCIESLHKQEYELCGADDIEIIIVDDGTPGERIDDRLPAHIHYLWQKKNMYGISRAKNTGAKLSNGRYIAFLDPDCLVGPHYFNSILRGFARFGDRVIQTGYVWGYHFDGSPDPRTEFGVWENPGRLTSRFAQVAGLNTALSRNVFEETLGFDEDLIYGGVEDLLFGFHTGLLPGTAVLFNREMEIWHIPHPAGGAHLNVGQTWEIIKRKWPEFFQYYVENGLR